MHRLIHAPRVALAGAVVCALIGALGACGPSSPGRGAPVATPTTVSPAVTVSSEPGQPVSFSAADGAPLSGTVFGSGATGVILSNMGDNDPAPWIAFAPLLVRRGYRVLSYSYRYPAYTNSFTSTNATQTVPDLLGAVAYFRSIGVSRIVLIGASLGGITTGKVGAASGAVSVVIISAEQDLVGYGLAVTPKELAALTKPKLFVASLGDTNTPYADTEAYYRHAPQPKQFQSFPGGVHGIGLFATEHGDELRSLLIDFVTRTAPV